MTIEVHGFCKPGFEPVQQAFEENFAQGLELGACVALTRDGEPVVDLYAGDAHPGGTPWAEDTIVNVYSTTKTMAATCVLMLADRGLLDLHAPVADYWPEFAQNGKQGVLVSHVMSHSAGLSGFDPPLRSVEALYDWDAIVAGLAAQKPWWEPGTAPGYHAMTQGFLQGELVRRISGRSIGAFFREEVAQPLGADFHIGLDPAHDARVGELVPPKAPLGNVEGLGDIAARTFRSVSVTGKEPQTEAWRRAEIPAAGGIGNARAVARIHSALACGGSVDGVTLMSEAGVARILEEQIRGKDLVMAVPIRFGMGFGLGFGLNAQQDDTSRIFYWGGWGGSLAVIDLDRRVSFAYVMNRMEADLLGDPRGGRLLMAAFQALAAA